MKQANDYQAEIKTKKDKNDVTMQSYYWSYFKDYIRLNCILCICPHFLTNQLSALCEFETD